MVLRKKDARNVVLLPRTQIKSNNTITQKVIAGKTRNKFRAKGTHESDGFFASQKELRRYRELQLLEKAKVIKDLKRQVRIKLAVNGIHIAIYIADATYIEIATNEYVIEDVKSPITRKLGEYRMKKALINAIFGVQIREI